MVDAKSAKKNNILVITLISVLVVLVLFGCFGIGVRIGRGFEGTSAGANVCTTADIDRYNKPILAEQPLSDYAEDFGALAKDIAERAGNEKDATCQYLLYAISYTKNTNTTNERAEAVKKLNSEGKFPNNQIYQLRDIKTMEHLLSNE